jgi:arylsulfatase A-like enzyme
MRCTPKIVLLAICFAVVAKAETPNVVLILADDMGYGDVQTLNSKSTIPTPHIDSLAAAGLTATDAHSPSAVCTPTRYGLLTGRYCWRTSLKKGVLGGYSKPLIEPNRSTIGAMLRRAGYRTGAVGKWHLGMKMPLKSSDANTRKWDGDPGINFAGVIKDSPIHHGFDYYFGVSASLDMAPYVYVRNDGFTMEPTLQQKAVRFPHFVRKGPRSEDFIIDQVLDKLTEEATGFIKNSAAGDKPFFLYMPLTGPHKPTQPHERFRGKTKLGEYGDFVHQVDWTVGQVLKSLKDAGVEDETLVIFTSDNGSYMKRFNNADKQDHVDDNSIQAYRSTNHTANGVLRGTKADIWEAGHRVPMFARWPGHIEAGSRLESTVCLTDIYATVAQITEQPLSENEAEDSVSMIPVVSGNAATRGVPVVHHSVAGMFAIRDGDWKLVAGNGSGGREAPRGKPDTKPFTLFNLKNDLSEKNDVASENPEVVARLSKALDDIRTNGRSVNHAKAAEAVGAGR